MDLIGDAGAFTPDQERIIRQKVCRRVGAGGFGGQQDQSSLKGPNKAVPGIVALDLSLIGVVEAGAPEPGIGKKKAAGLDDIHWNAHAGAKPEHGPGVLGNIGLKQGYTHSCPMRVSRSPSYYAGHHSSLTVATPRGHIAAPPIDRP